MSTIGMVLTVILMILAVILAAIVYFMVYLIVSKPTDEDFAMMPGGAYLKKIYRKLPVG